jgi:Ca2+-binding EF-hand superfamily protein
MNTRRPIITAIALSLAITGPALVAGWDGASNGIYDQDESQDKARNRGRGGNGGSSGRGGEDVTRMRFAGMDRNRDGRITRDEWRGSTNAFNRHDWNGDGVLSGIEVIPGARRPGNGGQQDEFDRLDTNDDGRISLSEWAGDRTLFDRLDRNDDGFLSRDEWKNRGNGGNGDEFDRLDINDDGRISLSEWPGNPALFDRLDRNDDGFLSRDEFKRSDDDRDDDDDDR